MSCDDEDLFLAGEILIFSSKGLMRLLEIHRRTQRARKRACPLPGGDGRMCEFNGMPAICGLLADARMRGIDLENALEVSVKQFRVEVAGCQYLQKEQ